MLCQHSSRPSIFVIGKVGMSDGSKEEEPRTSPSLS